MSWMEGKICLGWVGKREVYNIGVGRQKRVVTGRGWGGGHLPLTFGTWIIKACTCSLSVYNLTIL